MNGMIMTAKVLLDKNPHPSETEIKQALERKPLPLRQPPARDSRGEARQRARRIRSLNMSRDEHETQHEIDASISRRQFSRALARSSSASAFSIRCRLCWRSRRAPFAGASPKRLRSIPGWRSIADGNVTVFTSKVDLGTGVETALSQIVAEELDVPFSQIQMEVGDTTKYRRPGRYRRQPHHRTRRPAIAPGRRSRATAAFEDGVWPARCSGGRTRGERWSGQRAGNCKEDFLRRPRRRQTFQRAHRRHRRWLGPESRARCSQRKVPTITRSSAPRCRAWICHQSSPRSSSTRRTFTCPACCTVASCVRRRSKPSRPAWTKIR